MRYPCSVVLSKEGMDAYWVAKSACLKGCIGVGKTSDDAVKELEENEIAWLESAKELGIDIPPVPVEEEIGYSGRLSLRISPTVHKNAAEAAKREGISLNQFINDAIVNYTAEIKTAEYISTNVAMVAQEIGRRSLNGITTSIQPNRVMGYRNTGSQYRL